MFKTLNEHPAIVRHLVNEMTHILYVVSNYSLGIV